MQVKYKDDNIACDKFALKKQSLKVVPSAVHMSLISVYWLRCIHFCKKCVASQNLRCLLNPLKSKYQPLIKIFYSCICQDSFFSKHCLTKIRWEHLYYSCCSNRAKPLLQTKQSAQLPNLFVYEEIRRLYILLKWEDF